MERIFDYVNENCTVYDAVYNCLNKQKELDKEYVKKTYSGGLFEEKIDQIEHDYDINMDKLNFIPDLICMSEEYQKKFTSVALFTDYLDLDIGRKLDSILTFAALIGSDSKVLKLDDDKCYLLSSAMSSLSISDYPSYSTILSNNDLLENIMSKTNNQNERRKIIFELFDYCDNFVYDDMDNLEINKAINDCDTIVNSYKIVKEKIK